MKITKKFIIQEAVKALPPDYRVTIAWEERPEDYDCRIKIIVRKKSFIFNVLIKRNIDHTLLKSVKKLSGKEKLVVANYIPDSYKEFFRQMGVSFLEANGNAFVHQNELMIDISGRKPIRDEVRRSNRAFSQTGVKLIYLFLSNPGLLSLPLRKIEEETGILYTSAHYVLNGLKKDGYILKKKSDGYVFQDKRRLLDDWVRFYDLKLKQFLLIGRYRSIETEKNRLTDNIKSFSPGIAWSGEAGAYILKPYLEPVLFEGYSDFESEQLIKKNKLIPDRSGNIVVYKKFWKSNDEQTVNPILIYADLVLVNDPRALELSGMVYDEYLR